MACSNPPCVFSLTRISLAFPFLLYVLAVGDLARADDAPQPHRTGAFRATFTGRSPLSKIADIHKRMLGRPSPKPLQEYDLAKESFEVVVPGDYIEKNAHGLFVWVSSGDKGDMPGNYAQVLAKHKLIWIGANGSGNARDPIARFGLSLDAVHNMKTLYKLDANRIYISGVSGGGRITSRMGIVYPDVFAGGFPIVGCDHYKSLPVPGEKDKAWAARYMQPTGALWKQVLVNNRFVFLTGETDENRAQTKATYEAWKRDGIRQAHYLEVPAMGHTLPPPDWFEKGIALLDEPLKAATAKDKKTPASK